MKVVKIDTRLLNNDTAFGAGNAMGTYIWATMWCQQQKQRFVSRRAIQAAWVGERQARRDMLRLEREGLVQQIEGGWVITEYEGIRAAAENARSKP